MWLASYSLRFWREFQAHSEERSGAGRENVEKEGKIGIIRREWSALKAGKKIRFE